MRNYLPVSCWAAEDIPTNKVSDYGCKALSTPELLSIIIGSGTRNESSVELARRILAECENRLSVMATKTPRQLAAFNGIGQQKAAKILAAIELGRRRQQEATVDRPEVKTAIDIYNHMAPVLQDLDREEFWVLLVNQNWKLIRKFRLSVGGISEVSVDVRIVAREAVLANATVVAVCHNHPSGSLSPSKTDDRLTDSLKRVCDVMRLRLSDHVIIADNAYYSYYEQGKI